MTFNRTEWLARKPPHPDEVAERGTREWRQAIPAVARWLQEADINEWPEWPAARYERERRERAAALADLP